MGECANYIGTVLLVLKKLTRATSDDIARQLGMDSDQVSMLLRNYRSDGLVIIAQWRERSPVYALTGKGRDRAESDGQGIVVVQTMIAVYQAQRNGEVASALNIGTGMQCDRSTAYSRLRMCEKIGYVESVKKNASVIYSLTPSGVCFLSMRLNKPVHELEMFATQIESLPKRQTTQNLLGMMKTPQQLAVGTGGLTP